MDKGLNPVLIVMICTFGEQEVQLKCLIYSYNIRFTGVCAG